MIKGKGKGKGSVGGLVGHNSGGRITNCHAINAEIRGNGNVGGLVGTNDGGVIEGCSVINTNQIGEFIGKLKISLPNLELSQESNAEINAEISTIEHQLSSPKPKPMILVEACKSIRNILEGIAGNIVAAQLLTELSGMF